MAAAYEWTSSSDEETMEWEVVHGSACGNTEYDGNGVTDAWEFVSPVSTDQTWEETAEQDTSPSPIAVGNDICRRPQPAKTTEETDENSAKRNQDDNLKPCKSCNGYHYTSQCIYTLNWTEWLDCHLTYMPSQSFGHSPEGLGEDTSDIQLMYYRAEAFDEMAEDCEINYLSDTRLKANLMTSSSIDMFLDDEKWQKRLREDRYGQSSDEEDQTSIWRMQEVRLIR